MIPSYNPQRTVSFFVDLLGFKVEKENGSYFILYKDNLPVHILRGGSDIGEMECYLVVDDVEALWNSIKNNLTGIKVREPFDREYGMREFHIIIPETNTLMFIGQEIS
jgi:catechol 2,3-dioxygenase-like lactoylglutathione lyase family enzyme